MNYYKIGSIGLSLAAGALFGLPGVVACVLGGLSFGMYLYGSGVDIKK